MVFIPENVPDFRMRRSALFMPATNSRALEKARSLAADCLIFDLEDAIEGEARDTAHANLRTLVRDVDFGARERIIRIGGPEDLEVAIACAPDAVLVPKTSTAGDVVRVADALEARNCEARVWAMIETPAGLMNLGEIVLASSRLAALVVGPNDLSSTTGLRPMPGRPHLHPWLMMVIAAARSAGLGVLDGVYNNFRDTDGFAAECAQAAAMGFDGKTLIHPDQIAPANEVFGPDAEELGRAEKIVAAFGEKQNRGKGVIQIDGEMIERLHLRQAEALLKMATGQAKS